MARPDPKTCEHTAQAGSDVCPICVLEWIESRYSDAVEVPAFIGPYRILRYLGGGGMGDVYLAEQPDTKRKVALKTIRQGIQVDDELRRRLRDEIALLGQQRHPNIVTIFDGSGLHEEPPFFVMEWIDGGSLDEPAQRARFRDPRRAAALMVTVAQAVQSAHDKDVLHRDLKPSNVLIDESGKPYVSDFGVAKLIDRDAAHSPLTVVGNLGFMAPEQAGAIDQPPKAAADVYGLGATLYFLLTGRPPRDALDLPQLVEDFRDRPHAPVASLPARLDPHLRLVCCAALESDLERRYPTAAAFADDLRRVLEHRLPQPPHRPFISPFRRAYCAARRHPAWALLSLLAAIVLVSAQAVFHMREQENAADILHKNAALAEEKARTVLNQLRKEAEAVDHAARGVTARALLLREHVTDAAEELRAELPSFDVVFLLKPNGYVHARWPHATTSCYGRSFHFRDYFQGALDLGLGGGAYVSEAYFSACIDHNLKFAISSPVVDLDGVLLGVLVAAHATAEKYGNLLSADRYASGQFTDVLGPREAAGGPREAAGGPREAAGGPREAASASARYILLIHSSLHVPGQEYQVDGQLAASLRASFGSALPGQQLLESDRAPRLESDYVDPFSHERWLSALAPVGQTGLVVAVRTPYARARDEVTRLIPHLSLLNLSLLVLVSAGVGYLVGATRAGRAGERQHAPGSAAVK